MDPMGQDVLLELGEPFAKEDLPHVRTLLSIYADRAGRHLRRLEPGNPVVVVAMTRTDKGDKPPWLQAARPGGDKNDTETRGGT